MSMRKNMKPSVIQAKMANTAASELIAQHICPVCLVARQGVNPRRALQEHLRRSKRADHKLWYTHNYSKHFSAGGDRTQREPTAEEIREAIARTYGAEWAEHFQCTNASISAR
jgi:hypothetical protein